MEAMLPVLVEGPEDGVRGALLGEGEGDCAAELVEAEAGLGDGGEDGGAVDDLGWDAPLPCVQEEGDVCRG